MTKAERDYLKFCWNLATLQYVWVFIYKNNSSKEILLSMSSVAYNDKPEYSRVMTISPEGRIRFYDKTYKPKASAEYQRW